MNELARLVINRYQGNFPIEERPFDRVAADLDTNVSTLIETIGHLLDDGVLSRFGPLYDASSMGGGLTLAALTAPREQFDEIAGVINAMPEVAHNYEREHLLNMWFVVATENPEQLESALDRIVKSTELPVYNFPKLQTFYLGLWLHLDENGKVETRPVPGPLKQGGMIIDELDRSIVRATQAGLPLRIEPYTELADACGSDVETVMQRMRRMLERGVIRRIGVIPNHYRLGLKGNGMSVWDVIDDRIAELGARVGRLEFVSHCYQRPRHSPFWPYNLFAMIHGHDRDEVNLKREQVAELLGTDCRRHDVLFSTRILKKTGLRLVA